MSEKKKILLRLNSKLWNELKKWADDDLRSINSQIEYILQNAVIEKRKNINNIISKLSENGNEDEIKYIKKILFDKFDNS